MEYFDDNRDVVKQASCDDLRKQNNILSDLEMLFEKCDQFLVLKNKIYDEVIFKFFEAHLFVLRFRYWVVQELYASFDSFVWGRHYFFDRKSFVFQSLGEWPRLRNRQRSHYCFYFGKRFVETAANTENRDKWGFLHFSDVHYKTESELVQNWADESDFFTTAATNIKIYKELNEFIIDFDDKLQAVLSDRFYNHPCFDELCLKLHDCRIELTKLRLLCVKYCVGRRDARILTDVIQHDLEQAETLDLIKFRKNLR